MATAIKRPRSKFWHAAWRDASGRLHMRSTKQTNRAKALEIARAWEKAEHEVRSQTQVHLVLSDMLERYTGEKLYNPSVREHFEYWLERKNEETHKRYGGVANAFYRHLQDRADRSLKEVTPRDIETYIDEMHKAHASSKTIILHYQALSSAFKRAVQKGLLKLNPAVAAEVKLDLDGADQIGREIFSPEDTKKIMDAAEGEWKTLIRLGYYTGLRLTTAAGLRKANINWKGSDNQPVIEVAKPGKHGKPVTIPVHKDFIPHLKKALASTAADEEFLMPTLAGVESGGKRGLSRSFRRIVEKAGVDMREITRANGNKFCKRSFHSLRHGSTSDMANKGVSKELRMQITGHKTEREHAKYTHLQTETLREAVNTMDAIPERKTGAGAAKPAKKHSSPFRKRP